MMKKRVFELSKELDVPSKDIVQFLTEFGADVKNHMSTVEDHVAAIVKRKFRPDLEPKPEPKPAAPAAKPAAPASAGARVDPRHSPAAPSTGRPQSPDRPGQRAPQAPQARGTASPAPSAQTGTGAPRAAGQPPRTQTPPSGTQPYYPFRSAGQPPRPAQNSAPQGTRPPVTGPAQRPAAPGPGARPLAGGPPPQRTAQSAPERRPERPNAPRPGFTPSPTSRPAPQGQRPPAQGQRSSRPGGPGSNDGRRPSQGQGQQGGGRYDRQGGGHGRGPSEQGRPGGGFRRGPQPAGQRRPPAQSTVGKLVIGSSISVKDFAAAMGLAASEVIRKLMGMGVMATINQEIDLETATIVGGEFGVEVVPEGPSLEQQTLEEVEEAPEKLLPRPPVVTVMGHVDHGKTSLLDAIRETKVTAQEAGGITQHIGAYQVEVRGRRITFLDTPGHEAFTAMRARGAQVTDLVVLVVAADDGVMPQTVEAINHVKAAHIPMIVAINKIDKPGVNPDRVKQELTEYGLVAEEWGGDTVMAPVSAITRQGLDELLEMILLVSEMQDLRANPERQALGTVIEARLDKGRGPVATVLVRKGTLFLGDFMLAGSASGRVRVLVNDKGKKVKKAGPSTPVEVVGLTELPQAGDELHAVQDERVARQLADSRQQKKRESELRQGGRVTLEDLFSKIKEGEVKDLNIIVKADVRGSIEALQGALERLSNDEVRVRVIHAGVGGVTESDIMLAATSNAVIIGFNVRPDPLAKRAAERESVDIRLYRVIYDAINDVKAAMEGLLAPEIREVVVGRAEVRQTFKVPKAGTIAGCYVTEGKIPRSAEVRLVRDHIVIHEGKIDSLKRFKDDAREVMQGYECGIGLERFQDVKEGDIIEAFVMEEIKRKSS